MSLKKISILVLVLLGLCAVFMMTRSIDQSDSLSEADQSNSGNIDSTDLLKEDAGDRVDVQKQSGVKTNAVPANSEQVPASRPDKAIVAPGTVTDVFWGRISSNLGIQSVRGVEQRLYEFQIDPAYQTSPERKGNAKGKIFLLLKNASSTTVNPNLLKVEAYYNSETGFYETIHVWAVFSDYEYSADFSDDRKLVGAAHNVFVGKVLSRTELKNTRTDPETEFIVEVVENIKGKLTGAVKIRQAGAERNGILLVPAGNDSGEYLLKPGFTYILATRYNAAEDWYKLNPYPDAKKLVDMNTGSDILQLKFIAENDVRFKELKTAFKNEILLEADVRSGNVLNSYSSSREVKSVAAVASSEI